MKPFPLQNQVPEAMQGVLLDFHWDLEKLQGLDLPVIQLNVKDLEWHLDLPYWQYSGKPFQVSPRQVWKRPNTYSEQWQRTMDADLSCQIIVRNNEDRVLLLDGVHRLLKATIENVLTLEARLYTDDLAELITF